MNILKNFYQNDVTGNRFIIRRQKNKFVTKGITFKYYMEKEEPHPQVVDALGLRITNCAPCKSSL